MNEMLKELEQAGIRISTEEAEPELTAVPSYRGNIGFFRLIAKDWELLLVKGYIKTISVAFQENVLTTTEK